jgi:hypothetical protein
MMYDTFELIELVFLRPRMFCRAGTLRELMLFVGGVCTGRCPPHGSGCLAGFDNFLANRFGRSNLLPWTTILLDRFGDRDLFEASGAIAGLLHEWKSLEDPDREPGSGCRIAPPRGRSKCP